MVWLVGSKGMLGTEVAAQLAAAGIAFTATDLDVDITDFNQADGYLRAHAASWIVNCAAYTAVDQAEDEEERAYAINATGPENLARAAAAASTPDHPVRLIHISTDYVFNGRASEPIPEDAPVDPVGAYGRTKAAGERLLASACATHFIVRTAWLYGIAGKNFVSTMLRLMADRDELAVVADQVGSPTYAVDLAAALVAFITRDSAAYGTYHFTNAGETSWHGFAQAIHDEGRARGILTGECTVRPISTSEYPTKATRPEYSVLSKEKIIRELGLTIPPWKSGLARYLDTYQRNQE